MSVSLSLSGVLSLSLSLSLSFPSGVGFGSGLGVGVGVGFGSGFGSGFGVGLVDFLLALAVKVVSLLISTFQGSLVESLSPSLYQAGFSQSSLALPSRVGNLSWSNFPFGLTA